MISMNPELAGFLSVSIPVAEESVTWGDRMPLNITYYLCGQPPPIEYVSSVRAIVFRGDSVLVIRQEDGERYIIPGGRREKGEDPEETLRREVLEESGCTLASVTLFGFMHLHHLAPKPAGYEYPYPDFIWPIYLAEAGKFVPGARKPEQYAIGADFLPIEEVRQLPLRPGQRALLEAALKLRR